MIDAQNVPPVDDEEWLARFIVNSNEFRKIDDTVKPKLFMPNKLGRLSVIRHRDCTEEEIWQIGVRIAKKRDRALYGRADVQASSCRIEPLDVVPDPLPDNPNHADVIGYPKKREDQLSLATKLAAAASGRIVPPDRR